METKTKQFRLSTDAQVCKTELMDVLLGWLFNIFELTFFKRNIKGLFPYPENQVKKAKKGRNK